MARYIIPVWKMCEEVARSLPAIFTPIQVISKVQEKYPDVKGGTIRCQVMGLSPNHPSSRYYPKPCALFYYLGKGRFRLLEPSDRIVEGTTRFSGSSHKELMEDTEMPNREEFLRGCQEFKKHEKRDAMYKVAAFLMSHFWGKPSDMADGLGVLLLTWNQAFYRYGLFDFDRLEKCIAHNIQRLERFRQRYISSLSADDEGEIKNLFNDFLGALQIDSGNKMKGRRSPVAVAKALHLLAPNFFPVWDDKIARAYGCYYSNYAGEKYVSFCGIMKDMVETVKDYIKVSDKSLLKLLDEYNYSKYTKGWI